ncbi:MAG: hypothetical protein Q8O87_02410 [bacterium]|nr:hypothetical protein [bacterium]
MSRSWILLEVNDIAGEKTFKPLAGTEDKKCANRALSAMKLHKDEAIKFNRNDSTLIHTSVIDDIEYNASIDDCLDRNDEDEVNKILSLVNG